jgi:large subunit ribosomal protein L9
MQVILLTDVEKVGLRGEVVDVARGFARNYLLPRKLAEQATPGRVAELRKRDEQRTRQEARTFDQAQEIADALSETVLRFDVKAGPTGSLFGSVTATDVADELWRARKVRVDRRKIELAESIKRVGRYRVPIDLFQDVQVELEVHVVPEGGELPPEEEPVVEEPVVEEPVVETAEVAAESAPEPEPQREAEPEVEPAP